MSGMDYLHGAGVQEIISAKQRMSDIDEVEAAWMQTANKLKSEIYKRDAVISDLNAQLNRATAALRTEQDSLAQSQKECLVLKEKMEQRQREFKAAIDNLGDQIQFEAGDVHDATLDWIYKYGETQSHEFIQGLRHLFKYNMPMSQSESLRNRFIKEFASQARDAAQKSEAAGKGYFVSEEALQKMAGGLATGMAIEEKVRMDRVLAQRAGVRSGQEIGAGRHKPQIGPDEIAEAVGEGKFMPPEKPKGTVGSMYDYLPKAERPRMEGEAEAAESADAKPL